MFPNNKIDYTLLDNSASNEAIENLCEKATQLGVKSVCVMPKHVGKSAKLLAGSNVLVCSVVSFPNGANTIEEKIEELKEIVYQGADEIDVVWNYHRINEPEYLQLEISQINEARNQLKTSKGNTPLLKVIVESGLLTNEQTALATKICMEIDVDFIKTSTGKVDVGAEVDKVQIMDRTIGNHTLKIKASGGIRTKEQIDVFNPLVERFGIGYASVDKMNGINNSEKSNY
ncbi:MAG: deoxyribose-phosphate aldolase [Crocinitomicaceae bacterium]